MYLCIAKPMLSVVTTCAHVAPHRANTACDNQSFAAKRHACKKAMSSTLAISAERRVECWRPMPRPLSCVCVFAPLQGGKEGKCPIKCSKVVPAAQTRAMAGPRVTCRRTSNHPRSCPTARMM